ncbi:sulfurtransferase TusA family protein [Nitrosomonas sp. PY1]|uniref:sulfurtransferase TusA family protein n=1 Tax=Nitrosomonas sp. PY1 TaxID=1803906 RepID=UPI001FC8190C|nr:sulfurtransferase TusA family protein [Nitrosomonas sp. PY1]
MDFDKELNVSGLLCPLPILRTKQSLSTMSSGQLLKVITTDPASIIDFQVFSDNTGNELLSISETDCTFIFLLKKK